MSRSRRMFLAALAVLSCVPAQLLAQPGARVPVLIGFRQTPGATEQALVRAFGGDIAYSYTLVPAIAATVPQAALNGLRNNPLITIVEPDIQAFAIAETTPWGVSHIGALAAHAAGYMGNAVKVCVIDSGISTTHSDLTYAGGYDYVRGDAVPDDENGHGTHVAGTVAARINGAGVFGVAPSADLNVYKVLGANGSGSFSSIIAALQAAVAAGCKVTNNSYGSDGDPGATVKAAFDNAYAAGVLHIAAAGNSGNATATGNTVGFPAQYDSVVAVAAVDQNNLRASWSSHGPAVEIAAPGVDILSTYPANSYAYGSGTSMASPHVAGVAALIYGCGITTPAGIRAKLQQTAQDLGSAGRDEQYGYGLVRADAATSNCTPPAPVVDISVSFVSPPASVAPGSRTLSVKVENIGTAATTSGFQVALYDGGVFVSSQPLASLNAGASTTLNFAWSATVGSHTMTAQHSYIDKTGDTNDSASTVIQVTSISLSATGYKVKGKQKANLSWTGQVSNVSIKRNGATIANNVAGGAYTDNINKSGGGSYQYQVCDSQGCSNIATVTF